MEEKAGEGRVALVSGRENVKFSIREILRPGVEYLNVGEDGLKVARLARLSKDFLFAFMLLETGLPIDTGNSQVSGAFTQSLVIGVSKLTPVALVRLLELAHRSPFFWALFKTYPDNPAFIIVTSEGLTALSEVMYQLLKTRAAERLTARAA